MEEDQAPSRKASSRRRSTRLQASSSSIARPAPLRRRGKEGTEEGQARGASPPQYRMDESIVDASKANDLPQVMELHTEGITLDSVDIVRTAITTPTISLN